MNCKVIYSDNLLEFFGSDRTPPSLDDDDVIIIEIERDEFFASSIEYDRERIDRIIWDTTCFEDKIQRLFEKEYF